MASFLESLGLSGSSGVPTNLTDEELAAYQAAQANAASRSEYVPTVDLTQDQDKLAAPAQASAQAKPTADPADVNKAPVASSQPSAQATGGDKPGFLSRMFSAIEQPNVSQALIAAGANMMANTNYGTSGWSAIGQGIQAGQGAYNQLRQQQIMNQMAGMQYQRQAVKDQAEINSKNAETQGTQLANQQIRNLQAYMAKAGANFNPMEAVAYGASPDAATKVFQSLHPNVQIIDNGMSNVLFDPMSRQVVATMPKSQVVQTPAGSTSQVVTGPGAAFGGPGASAGSSPASGTGVSSQTLQQGGMTPKEQADAIAPFTSASQQAATQGEQINNVLGKLQTAEALTGNSGGVQGAAYRALKQNLGVTDPNSFIRQKFAAMNVTQELALLPSNAKPNQFLEKSLQQTVVDADKATPTQLLTTTAYNSVMAQAHQVDADARAAYVQANGGTTANLTKATTITVNGMQRTYPTGTSIAKVSADAREHFVDWNPPLINPEVVSAKNMSNADIQKILTVAKDPAKRAKLQEAGLLLPPMFGGGK